MRLRADGRRRAQLLLNLRDTKIVNSIGISILIEIIEKMIDKGGKIAFCCLTPVIHKTFQIMGLANYATIFRRRRDGRSKELRAREGPAGTAGRSASAAELTILRNRLGMPLSVHQIRDLDVSPGPAADSERSCRRSHPVAWSR